MEVLKKGISIKDEIISTQEKSIATLQKGIVVRDNEILRLDYANKSCNVEVKRQKSQKVWFLLGGGLVGMIAGFYLQ